MYLNNGAKGQNETCFAYDFSRGVENSRLSKRGRVTTAMNVEIDSRPEITSIGGFYRASYPSDAVTVGGYEGTVYYNTQDSFYYDGVRKGGLTHGKKTYINYKDCVYIFPDRVYYDIKADKFDTFYRSVEATIMIEAVDNEFVASYFNSSAGNLAEYFDGIKSISISGTEKGKFDGCFRINSVDRAKGKVKFGYCEKGFTGSSASITRISSEAPALEGACICKNRICGYIGNKIYMSAVGEALSWCDCNEDDSAFSYEDLGGDGFTACCSIDDQPVYFTGNYIYKIYGNTRHEYSLRMIQGCCGIKKEHSGALVKIFGNIYFISGSSIYRFSGSRCDEVCSLGKINIRSCVCGAHLNKMYAFCVGEGFARLFSYDTESEALSEIGLSDVRGFLTVGGSFFAVTSIYFSLLYGDMSDMPREYFFDRDIHSSVEFDEIHNGSDMLSPMRLCVRCEVSPNACVDFYCMYDNCGEWKKVYSLSEARRGLLRISLPSANTDSFRLKILGSGDYKISGIYLVYA